MLVTFVIGLREGLEAALIVGIVAGFLVRRSGRWALRPMWLGVGGAVSLSLAVALALAVAGRSLTFRARETMEAVLALVAVTGVVYMIVWMRRHGPALRAELEDRASAALATGSVYALAAMAFLAVAREGLESAVFLLATVRQGSVVAGTGGALIGFGVAAGLGYGIYRGAVRIDLQRFFAVTGVVLVVVAAGLVVTAFHDLAEAGLVDFLSRPAVDLSAVIVPGSVQASLVTAFVGIRPVPSQGDLVVWAAFAVPALAYVLWPRLLGARLRLGAES